MGTPSLKQELESCGLTITEKYEEDIACVLVAFDTTLSFRKLEDASRILSNGEVIFLASNPDLTAVCRFPMCLKVCLNYTSIWRIKTKLLQEIIRLKK